MDATRKWNRFCRLFDEKIEKQENGCWHWTGFTRPGSHPYGKIDFTWNGEKFQLAHRFAWLRKHGSLDPLVKVLHSCDNPRCVNPDHLFLGTQQDNIADATAKGRMRSPSGNRNAARLTLAQSEQVKAATGTQKEIAARFGISQSMVSLIKLGKTQTK
jgi:HNH endonuclease